ncbi:uncharacterized protein [Anabrus simplex]|uniref:uncharacterized protein n=1 Tax=Anabrus simplex TaxID=316456 RepID=UPI0035A2C797
MLKYTQVNLELLTDIDMVHFIKSSIRGGLSQCSGRYSKANNKYMPSFDSSQESQYIVYLDANNQYGWAMSQHLPVSGFRWLTQCEFDALQLHALGDEADKGYFLEVDLQYPKELHTSHNDLLFCPENMKPPYIASTTKMLIANLCDKSKYIILYRNLKQCLQHGLKLSKIHRVLEFNQSPWLKPYIDLNNNLRTNAVNEFEKDFYKLMNNSVFGKTMENVDKRVDVKLITNWENIKKRYGANYLISKPNFHSCTIIHENLVIIQMNRVKVKYDKPTYVGFAVLELAKTLMYEFHYDYMMKKYAHNAQLLYTDTDSFIYQIKTDDYYNDIKPDLGRFDTSNYPANNQYHLPLVNKKFLGKMKDECAGNIICSFVGTKSKSYCIKLLNELQKRD